MFRLVAKGDKAARIICCWFVVNCVWLRMSERIASNAVFTAATSGGYVKWERRLEISARKVIPLPITWSMKSSQRSIETASEGVGELVGNTRRSRPKLAALPPKNRASSGVRFVVGEV